MIKRVGPVLSQVMLLLGGFMILAGMGWGIWTRLNAPPPPTITEAGAVVLAMTSPVELTTTPATDTPTAMPAVEPSAPVLPTAAITSPTALLTPTLEPIIDAPAPDLLPDWTITQAPPEPTSVSLPATPPPPTPSPAPTATRPPEASQPPTRIVAPAIKLDAPIQAMSWAMVDHEGRMRSEWVVPKKAAGWHVNSALPGQRGNMVISGHHNIEGKVFRYVVDLVPGDEITVYVGDTPYTYVVSEKYILKETGMPLAVRKKNAQWIMPTEDERLTLVTCWPYEWPGNSHRVIVVARPAGETDAVLSSPPPTRVAG